jgi:2-polyprenyl-3-methyl-5-hydroxy-6-metoxy-1,4-benzoquinol methylase
MQCPLCNSMCTRVMKSIAVEPLVAEWQRSFKIDVREEFHGLTAFEIRSCSECSLQFFTPELLTGSAELYEKLDKFVWYYMPRKWEHDAALKDLVRGTRILEVGCGFGDFVSLAGRELGVRAEGLEQNTGAIQEAEKRGLPVRKATVEEAAKQSPGEYDAICSFQVMEHVPRPGRFVTACCALLRPGGKLILGLPNADSFLRYQFNLLDLPPHHMSRWPVSVFSKLSRYFPVRLRRVQLEPLADHHVEGYVDAYFSALARGPLARLGRPRMKAGIAGTVRRFGLRQWLRGQTTYVCYERI